MNTVNATLRQQAKLLEHIEAILAGPTIHIYDGSVAPGFEICSDRPIRQEAKPIVFSRSAVVAIRDALAIRASGDAEIVEAARDLVGLWQEQKISGLPRSERNAAIEGVRNRLIEIVNRPSG